MSDIGTSHRGQRSLVRQAAEGIGIVTLAAGAVALAAFLLAVLAASLY